MGPLKARALAIVITIAIPIITIAFAFGIGFFIASLHPVPAMDVVILSSEGDRLYTRKGRVIEYTKHGDPLLEYNETDEWVHSMGKISELIGCSVEQAEDILEQMNAQSRANLNRYCVNIDMMASTGQDSYCVLTGDLTLFSVNIAKPGATDEKYIVSWIGEESSFPGVEIPKEVDIE